jgi:hypothetical protein
MAGRNKRLLFALVALLFVALPACGGDDAEDGEPENTADIADANADGAEDDVDIALPCPGLGTDKAAKDYNDECEGVEECTAMPKKNTACYCAWCGPVGGKVECVQALCPPPGG